MPRRLKTALTAVFVVFSPHDPSGGPSRAIRAERRVRGYLASLRAAERRSRRYADDMDLHRQADKVEADAQHLKHAVADDRTELALSIAKRIRRDATNMIKLLAQRRDEE